MERLQVEAAGRSLLVQLAEWELASLAYDRKSSSARTIGVRCELESRSAGYCSRVILDQTLSRSTDDGRIVRAELTNEATRDMLMTGTGIEYCVLRDQTAS